MYIYDLKTEHLTKPQAVDAPAPRFSWKLSSNRRSVVQRAYRVICRAGERVLWDSGRVESDAQTVRYDGPALPSRTNVSWRVWAECEDERGRTECAESGETEFFTAISPEEWRAKWISPPEESCESRKPSPYLRRVFRIHGEVKNARIWISAHGLYEVYINGVCPTTDKFKPGLTSYYLRIQYQTYDITHLLREGENVWSARLADGWWRGVSGGTLVENFGKQLALFGQIMIEYADGRQEIVATDEQFRCGFGGLLASDMMMGDIFDARKEPDGWMCAGFDDGEWRCARSCTEHTQGRLIPSRSVPVREHERFEPVIFTDGKGDCILDFGQNIAGYVQMHLHDTRAGQKIVLTHGEALKDGCFYTGNIDKPVLPVPSFQRVDYICRGGEESYCPDFAVFGFRYVRIEGYKPAPEEFTAIAVYSDMKETGRFACSDALIDKLVSNSLWSQKGNFLDVATDCPTRERNAWTGDAQVFAYTSTCFMDVLPFYEKWLYDQKLEQFASGKVGITFPSTSSRHDPAGLEEMREKDPSYALAGPDGNGNVAEDSVGWGDSAVHLPYIAYLCYGDLTIVHNQYDTAKRWVDHMLACAEEKNPLYEQLPQYRTYTDGELDADYIYDTRMHFGEWNEPLKQTGALPEGVQLSDVLTLMAKRGAPLVATAYLARSAQELSELASVIGKKADAEKYAQIAARVRAIYDKYFISEDGVIEKGHQAAYVRALAFDLVSSEKRPKVLAQLLHEIKQADDHLNTGFLSTPYLLHVLAENGCEELAYRLLLQKSKPSWLASVVAGATTIPESWDGFFEYKDSLNHYSYGAVCGFLFAKTAGISPLMSAPGYRQFVLHPIAGPLTSAEAEYECPFGIIRSAWEKKGDKFVYRCSVPVGTRARLILPDGEEHLLGSGEYVFTCVFCKKKGENHV